MDRLIGKLPFELIAKIFSMCLRKERYRDLLKGSTDKLDNPCTSLILSHVCSMFRSVAFNAPELWQDVILPLFPKNLSLQAEMARAWLARTQGTPVNLCLYQYANRAPMRRDCPDRTALVPFIDALMDHSHQWRSLYLKAPADILDLITPTKTSEGILESFCLDLLPCRGKKRHTLDLTAVTSKLWQVDLRGIATLNNVAFQTSHLTTFSACKMDYSQLRDILSGVPGISSFKISELQISTSTTMLAHNLRVLEIGIGHEGASILTDMTLPCLRELTMDDVGDSAMEASRSLIKRSKCSLHKMCIYQYVGAEDTLTRLLDVSPSLEELQITILGNSSIGDNFFEQLSGPLLPTIRVVDLTAPAVTFNWEQVCVFLESRSQFTSAPPGNHTLDSFTLQLGHKLYQTDFLLLRIAERMTRLKVDGLSMMIESPIVDEDGQPTNEMADFIKASRILHTY